MSNLNQYLVVATYTGECCSNSHALTCWVNDEDDTAAAVRVRAQLLREGHDETDVGEVLVFTYGKIPTIEDIEAESADDCEAIAEIAEAQEDCEVCK